MHGDGSEHEVLAIGDRTYEYRDGEYLVASVDLPITGHFSQASLAEPAHGESVRQTGVADSSSATARRSDAQPPGVV